MKVKQYIGKCKSLIAFIMVFLPVFLPCLSSVANAEVSQNAELMRIWKDGKLGLANASGELVTETKYIPASRYWSEGFLWVATSSSNLFSGTFLDSRGKELFPPVGHVFLDDVMRSPPSFDGGWAMVGFETIEGKTSFSAVLADGRIVPLEWNWWWEVVPLKEDGSVVGFINLRTGEQVPAKFEDAQSFVGSIAPVKIDGKWGVVDKKGVFVVPAVYDEMKVVDPWHKTNAFIHAKKEGKSKFIHQNGDITPIDARYTLGEVFTDGGVAKVSFKGKVGLIDIKTGKTVVKPKYDSLHRSPGSQAAWMEKNGKFGLVKYGGGILQPFEYHDVYQISVRGPFSNHAEIWKVKSWVCSDKPKKTRNVVNGAGKKIECVTVVNGKGEVLLSLRDSYLEVLQDSIVRVHEKSGVGLWDLQHRKYSIAPAKKDGKWGFVDVNGDWKILPKYEGADSFLNGYAAVKLDGKTALINRSGEPVTPFKYDGAGYVQNGRFPVAEIRNGKEFWGIADIDGTIILPIEYDTVEWIDLELGRMRFHGKPAWGLQLRRYTPATPAVASGGESE